MSERFYLNSQLDPEQRKILAGPEAHHLINVMRAKPGDLLQVFDGRGNQADAVIVSSNRREVEIELQQCYAIDRRPATKVLIAASVPKGERLRFMVEKLTELGAYAWLPLQAKRSVNPLNPSTEKKAHQWIVDACKQSERNHLLECLSPMSVAQVLSQFTEVPKRWIAAAPKDLLTNSDRLAKTVSAKPVSAKRVSAEPVSAEPVSAEPVSANVEPASVNPNASGLASAFDQIILIGPEGGFTSDEVLSATENGFQPIQVGNSVLRIETAAVALLTKSLCCGSA